MSAQKGITPLLLILLAALGIIIFLLISQTFPFKDKLFNLLFPKPSSLAQGPSVEDQILIKFKPGVLDQAREKILNSHALEKIDTIPEIEVELTKVAEQAKDKVIEALNNNPLIEYAEPNFLGELAYEPNDPAWQLSTSAQWGLKKIGGAASWDITRGNSNFVVAVIDSGMMTSHEDLKDKAVKQYNAYDGTTDVTDTNGHGTVVAGVVGELTDNGQGGASLGWNTPIMPIKIVTPLGFPDTYAAARALIYAADNAATSINMSVVFSYGGTTLKNGVDYAYNKGVVLAAAVGNNGTNVILYPAGYDNVIAVGGTDAGDNKWSSSNYGVHLDVMAPATGVYSTANNGSYSSTWTGTSYATPFVATLAALIRAINPSLTNVQVTEIITSTALDLGVSGWDEMYGWGRIQADKALQKASGITPPPPDTQAPTTSITSPGGGSTISGVVDITADATDNVGVIKVEFYTDGVLHATDVTSPYLASWDTTTLTNSSHTLFTKAYDNAGNVGQSSVVNVNVDNTVATPTPNPILPDTTKPTVAITYPLDGSVVSRNSTVNIAADASDNVKVAKVEFRVNNSLKCSPTVAPYTCNWKVPGKRGASYIITAKAYDSSNNQQSATVKVISQ